MRGKLIASLVMYGSLFATEPSLKPTPSFIPESPPTAFVNSVHVMSGNFYFSENDISVPGSAPMHVQHSYNSDTLFPTWFGYSSITTNFPVHITGGPWGEETNQASLFVDEGGGSLTEYTGNIKGIIIGAASGSLFTYHLSPGATAHGFTNTGGGEISSRTNSKNTHYLCSVSYSDEEGKTLTEYERRVHALRRGKLATVFWKWTGCLADGTTRNFEIVTSHDDKARLQHESRPNGNQCHYRYSKDTRELQTIEAKDSHNQRKLNQLDFSFYQKKDTSGRAHVRASNGKEVLYYFFTSRAANGCPVRYVDRIEATDAPTTYYKYTHRKFRDQAVHLLKKIERPEGRFLEIEYDNQGKVLSQSAPAGKNGEVQKIFSFEYHPDHNITHVYDALHHKTSYQYAKNKRLVWTRNYTGKDKPYRSEYFQWGHSDTVRCGVHDDSCNGNLLSKTITNEKGKGVYAWKAEYDKFGNITKESVFGNLSGACHHFSTVVPGNAPDTRKQECYSKYAAFKNQGHMHLKVREWEDSGATIQYQYKPGTDLVSAKFTCEGQNIKIREYFDYDDAGTMVQKIVDDGSSGDRNDLKNVSERMITHIKPVSAEGCHGAGQPEEIQECHLDLKHNKEHQIKRTTFEYDQAGNVIKQTVYNTANQKRYSMHFSYDGAGRMLSSTDPIGRKTTFAYDQNGNKIREELVNSGKFTTYTYDKMNRLIQQEEHHNDKKTYVTTYTYDVVGNLTSMTDLFGNTTKYGYDERNRRISITYPGTENMNGGLSQNTEKRTYDIFDAVLSVTDTNGHTTKFERNCRGQITKTMYPDGSSESCTYYLNGLLKQKIERNGSKHVYAYDFLQRPTEEKVFDTKNKQLYVITNTYNAFHLLSTKDAMGFVTTYTYNHAGQKVMERKQGGKASTKVTYSYDSMGRMVATKLWDGPRYVSTESAFDNCNREIEHRVVAHDKTMLQLEKYHYDIFDNIVSKETFKDVNTKLVTSAKYNSKNLPIEKIDAEGNKTSISYDYGHKNKHQQRVLQTKITDPLGITTYQTYDSMNRCVLLEKKDGKNSLLSQSQCIYSGTGNKLIQKESVVVDGHVTGSYTVAWEYDSCDHVLAVIEEPKTGHEKRSKWTYNKQGLLQAIIQPNGVSLQHSYDTLGRLQKLVSSDQSIHYEYTYDLHNNPTRIVDKIHSTNFVKTYDPWDHMTKETFGALAIQYRYDMAGRIRSIQLPDTSSLEYRYAHGHFSDIIRYDTQNKEKYRHSYSKIDLQENVLESTLPGTVGIAAFSWSKKGVRTGMKVGQFSEEIPTDGIDACGNIRHIQYHDVIGNVDGHFSYDGLYQLAYEEAVEKHTYTHNSLSSRLTLDGAKYTIDELNRMVSSPTNSCSYDSNGNLAVETIQGQTTRYRYDALNRLIECTSDTQKVVYLYDNANRRIGKKVTVYRKEQNAWETTLDEEYLYQGNREIGSFDKEHHCKALRILGRGRGAEVGAAVAIELRGEPYVPVHDHAGNVVALLEFNGTPHECMRYSAFGNCYSFDEKGQAKEQSECPWLFVSKRLDREIKSYYFGARYYKSEYGRWITPDPLNFADGPNLYAYVHNNPISLLDPYGMATMLPFETIDRLSGTSGDFYSRNVVYYGAPSEEHALFSFEQYRSYYHSSWRNMSADEQTAARYNWEHMQEAQRSALLRDHCDQSQRYYLRGNAIRGRIGYVNGMLNRLPTALRNARYIQNLSRGAQIHGVHNFSAGAALDTHEAMDNLCGYNSRPVRLIQREIETFCAENPDVSVKYLLICHSQGAIQVRNALRALEKPQRDRVLVLAIAPAAYISKEHCANVRHIVSDRDQVPKIDSIGRNMALQEKTIKILHNDNATGWDHSFQSSTYSGEVSNTINAYLNNPRMTQL